jgi:tetratricopeptide (TPR) repeat protein
VQDDIAQAVVKELRTTLLGATPDSDASGEARAAVAAAAKGRGENGEAHRLFLQGRYLANQLSGPDLVRGIEHLRQAVELDPGYALAWASLSWAHAYGAGLGFSRVDEGNARAREAAERALELEPELAEAHIALATVQLFHDLDWRGAEASLCRALELAPDSTEVLRTRGFLAYHTGRLEEAVALCRRAVEQDPLSSAGYNYLGRTYRAAGRLPEAEAVLRKAIELSPEGVGLREQLALAVEAQGRAEEALVLAESEPADWARWCGLAVVHARAGRMAESARLLDELVARRKNVAAFQVAIVHAARGEVDEAFAWLEKALAQRDAGLTLMKCEPLFEGLHADSRWGAFLEKLGLAD